MTTDFNKHNWRPTATLTAIQARAKMYKDIRNFFNQRDVLEVETPIIGARGVTNPYIQSFMVTDKYLQTSPEYAMKRLLAAGFPSIYQICKVFRTEEAGRLHNPEFTMLEWYRLNFNHVQLMDETDDLLQLVLNCGPCKRISYHELFRKFLQINPHTATLEQLQLCADNHGINLSIAAAKNLSVTDWLQLLMSHLIEPKLLGNTPWIVYDFPAAQAALSKIIDGEHPTATRFEVYMYGIELANGYYELQNVAEQQQRFAADNQIRATQGISIIQEDERLLAALEAGFPDCAGIALGLDRLLMLKINAKSITETISFCIDNA